MSTDNTRNCPKINPQRTYLAIDVENAARTGSLTTHDADVVHWRLALHFPDLPDLTLVAANPRNALVADRLRGLYFGALRCRAGKNGADLVIIEHLENLIDQNSRHPERPVTRVVLVSGDGIFARVVGQLRQHGIHVTVVAHSDTASRALMSAADAVVVFDNTVYEPVAA